MGRLGLLQLDSVPVVMRTQYLPLFARLGPYDPNLLDRVAYRDDEWFETWCHEASLMPVEDEPLMRWHKQRAAAGQTWKGLSSSPPPTRGISTRYSTRFGNVRLRRLNSSTPVRETVRGGATGPKVRSRSTGCFGSARLGSVVVLGS